MNQIITIDIQQLQNAVNLLLDGLKEQGIHKVELREDYYWAISGDLLYNVVAKPQELAIGSLYDDLRYVEQLNREDAEPINLLLLKISPLLQYIGQCVP